MSASPPIPEWQSGAASSLKSLLTENEWMEIEDVVALTGDRLPQWLQQLAIRDSWNPVTLPDDVEVALARVAVHGQRGDGGWDAAETISVFGYTGWPMFSEVVEKSAGVLRHLGASDVVTKALAVPPRRWTAAVRSTGTALIEGRPVWATDSNSSWVQQTSYVAGSADPHAGRLIVHSLFIAPASRPRLGEEIDRLSEAVYQGFIGALLHEHRNG